MTGPTATRRPIAPVPHRRATTLLTLVVPALLLAAATAVALGWRDRLPDPLASHWGPDGVDGTQSFAAVLALVPGLGVPFAVLAWAIAYFAGHAAMTRRFAAGLAIWVAGFTSALTLAMLGTQLDLADAAEADDLGTGLVLSFLLPLGLAAAAAWATPGDAPRPTTSPVPASAPRLPLDAGAQASWVRRLEWVHPGVVVLIATASAGLMGAVSGQWWFAVALLALLLVVGVGLTTWTVTVDRRGLVARARFPRPRLVVPLDEVEHAEVVSVRPVREFGGWGFRIGLDGRVGVIVRKGEALEVTRTGGRRVVITIDDAGTGAALLNTLAARAR